MKAKLFLVLATAVAFAGCASTYGSRIELPYASRGADAGIREVSVSQAWRPDAVLFENRIPDVRAECAFFHGALNEESLLVPIRNGSAIGLAQEPIIRFDVSSPRRRTAGDIPGAAALAGLGRGQDYTYLCVCQATLGGTTGFFVRPLRLGGPVLRQEWHRIGYYGPVISFVNWIEYLGGCHWGTIAPTMTITIDLYAIVKSGADAIRRLNPGPEAGPDPGGG